MHRWLKLTGRTVVGIVILLAFSFTLWPVYGSELDRLKREQQRLNQRLEQDRRLLQDTNREISQLMGQLDILDEEIENTEKEMKELGRQLSSATQRVAGAEQELKEAESALAERTEVFRSRLKEIYLNGQVNYLEVLMQSTSITDFLVRFDLLKKIAEQDMEILDGIEADRRRVEQKKAELEQRRDEIAGIKVKVEAQQARMEQKKKEKEVAVARLEKYKDAILRDIEAEERTAREIGEKIRSLQSNSGKYTGGKMTWPLPGYSRITSDYGWRTHPILKIRSFHAGIDIAAPTGTNVVASEAGKVIFTGWYGAYGNAVVVDHGGGVTTTYSHLSKILVKEKEQVTRGQVVGKVGSTGLSTGPHLDFSVRINGKSVSPWDYLTKN
ncbi:hypothetical protein SY88_14740 [Clostridiales bacterium PH28_bin88]|nr:hypothetical protein SY88_14740 [Clostridiales bacterium PH28_bin88]